MHNLLQGRKILFLSPSFFAYEELICQELKKLGAQVDWYDERPIKASFLKGLARLFPFAFGHFINHYYKHLLWTVKNNEYDDILIVKGEFVTRRWLLELKKQFPLAKIRYVLWDSKNNTRNSEEKIQLADITFSFDYVDCKQDKRLIFRPNFYTNQAKQKQHFHNCKYDLCFIGSIHSDRLAILQKIQKICLKNKWSFFQYCYLQAKFLYFIYFLIKPSFHQTKISFFKYHKLSWQEVEEKMAKAKVIVDIEHPQQSGIGTRTFDAICLGKKLITTNKYIKNYDFYNANNILIIDRKKIVIPASFLRKETEDIADEILEKYSLKTWILSIFEVVK